MREIVFSTGANNILSLFQYYAQFFLPIGQLRVDVYRMVNPLNELLYDAVTFIIDSSKDFHKNVCYHAVQKRTMMTSQCI